MKDMIERTKDCPHPDCGSSGIGDGNIGLPSSILHYKYCKSCHMRGPLAETPDLALATWNEFIQPKKGG